MKTTASNRLPESPRINVALLLITMWIHTPRIRSSSMNWNVSHGRMWPGMPPPLP